ncbi:MAG: hypothetical protein F9K44_11670, partial [Hyphomicrobiaceae bacterium]
MIVERLRLWTAAGVVLMAGGAMGQTPPRAEACVSCSGPEAVYRCVVEAPDGNSIPADRAQLFCIERLAKDGGHQSCAVRRREKLECAGIAKRFSFEAALLGPEVKPAETPLEKPKVPATIVEASEKAVEASKKSLD